MTPQKDTLIRHEATLVLSTTPRKDIRVPILFASVRAGRGARHTDFHSMLVLLGGICQPEAGCQVLDSDLLLFLKHTNIWFSYKVPFKILSLA